MGGMARQPRIEMKGGVHHVFARGNDRRVIYLDDADRYEYLRLLGRVVPWKRWRCLSFCLMDNHVHLLIETPQPNLGSGMQWLHGRFAQLFNERHERCGHVFQGRFGSVLVKTDAQLWTTVNYIARNPVDAGLCAQPGEWPWGSHHALVGGGQAPDWLDGDRLLEFYSSLGGDPHARYVAAVERR
jgi:REP element-mobilizing transposase RayT